MMQLTLFPRACIQATAGCVGYYFYLEGNLVINQKYPVAHAPSFLQNKTGSIALVRHD